MCGLKWAHLGHWALQAAPLPSEVCPQPQPGAMTGALVIHSFWMGLTSFYEFNHLQMTWSPWLVQGCVMTPTEQVQELFFPAVIDKHGLKFPFRKNFFFQQFHTYIQHIVMELGFQWTNPPWYIRPQQTLVKDCHRDPEKGPKREVISVCFIIELLWTQPQLNLTTMGLGSTH